MEYRRDVLDFKITENTAITFGKFDGLHRGHELLIENLLEQSKQNGYQSVIFTFDIPPASTKQITTNEERCFLFERTGVDYLLECPFTPEVKAMEPYDFLKWIVESFSVKSIVVGNDFCFGKNRKGDHKFLEAHKEEFGYDLLVLDKMEEDGREIGSTYIREELMAGNLEKANHLLGYSYFIKSVVVHGNKLGRTIGIPTINMILPEQKLLPPNGVYVTRVCVDEKWYAGVSNVGRKPTVGNQYPIGVETYIIDFCQDLYDREILVEFLAYIRPEKKFGSIDELKEQMSCDIAYAGKYYKNVTEIC